MIDNPAGVLAASESLCPQCLQRIPAFYIEREDGVHLVKTCRHHGTFDVPVWRGEIPFSSWVRYKTPAEIHHPFTEVERGCPYDCGICPSHRQHTCTALIEVTQRCNLGCAYCFASSHAGSQGDLSLEHIRFLYRRLLDAGGPYNIQLSGGEPTLRDDLPQIISMGRSMGFSFIQVNTNGVRFASDFSYLERLKEAGLSSVFLQFDGINDEIYRKIRGRSMFSEKLAAIENCAALDIGIVLVPVLIPGVNDKEIGKIIRFALEHMPAVRGVHYQPVSYFGRYPREAQLPRITIPEVIQKIEEQSNGLVKAESFKPPGCENALCSFHGNYVLMPDGQLHALTRHHPECCFPAEDGVQGSAKSRRFVSRKWTVPEKEEKIDTGSGLNLGEWEVLAARVKSHSFSISGMAFQDSWTIDLERLKDCCIHIASPDGRLVPFCAYNLTALDGGTLYRQVVLEEYHEAHTA